LDRWSFFRSRRSQKPAIEAARNPQTLPADAALDD